MATTAPSSTVSSRPSVSGSNFPPPSVPSSPSSGQIAPAPGGTSLGSTPGTAPGTGGPPGAGAPPTTGAPPGAGHGGSPNKPMDLKKINAFFYQPSFSMTVVGSCLFLISSGLHLFQLFKYKSWYFAIVTQGVLMSAAAMIARTHSVITLKQTGATGPYVIFSALDSIAPTMIVIGNIFTLTRVIWWVTPNERRNIQTLKAPPKMMSFMWAGLFAIGDIGKLVGQKGFPQHSPNGLKVEQVGLVLQVMALSGFFLFALRFMRMSRRWVIHSDCHEKKWRDLGWTTVLVAGILAVRHMFTVVQFDARRDPKAFFSQHEWMYWLTVTLPLFLCYSLYNLNFPGEFLPREYTGFALKLKEIEKAKFESPWPLTISSPIRSDDKGQVEIALTEIEDGRMGGRSHRH